jgi:hypothetical protein
MLQPTYYVPHGGGPCFFMDDPQGVWTGMADFLRGLPSAAAREIRPRLPILLATGYAELPAGSPLSLPRISKPYQPEKLEAEIVKAVKQTIGRRVS